MANIKSAKKRILVNRTKAARNKAIRSAVKTSIKKVEAAVENKDKAAAEVALVRTQSPQSARLHPRAFITKITAPEKFPVFAKLSTALRNRQRNILVISL